MKSSTIAAAGISVMAISAILTIGVFSISSGRLNYRNMKISQHNLYALNNLPQFSTLFLNPEYDRTGVLKADEILLTPSAWTQNLEAKISLDDIAKPFIEIQAKGIKYPKNLIFSNYELPKRHVTDLLAIPRASYFIFEANYYEPDSHYLYYRIIPYTVDNVEIPVADLRVIHLDPSPPARPY